MSSSPAAVAAPSQLHVCVGDVDTILPSAPTELGSLYLSQIDQCVAYIVDTVFFYPAPSTGAADPHDVVSKLRQCLSDILVPYHFMTGRLAASEEGGLQIDCNRKGALFASASSKLALDEVGDLTYPNPAFRSLVLQAPKADKMTDSPLFMMQVTVFRCGGFCIGFSMNHAVFDGYGAFEFLLNFSSLARGEGLVVEPKPDRTMLKPRKPPQINFEHTEYLKLTDVPKDSSFTTADIADVDFAAMQLSQKHEFKVFPFSGDMLNRLKNVAMSDASLQKCSTFDAIAAHVWQSRTKALGMPPLAPSKMLYAVDIRSRLRPPLPKGFVGNGIVSGFVSLPAEKLQKEDLSYAVRKVQEATEKITDEYVRSSLDWGATYGGVPNLPGGIFLSAWWKLPFHMVDFGWGIPSYAGPVRNSLVEFVLLLSNGTSEGLNIFIALEPDQMQEFEKIIYSF
ncbi:hypothetical protein KP509_12G059200 [Ceratopteris richardii]|uniref:Uncharacterized protein n=1 Tax=Ceratopteris richardii TaxID=49495 RepID=A0A8T2TSL6_CERRI|nr:hypothetical protein KP509_12G059200 [Ceratopteris richardii]